MIVDCISDLHGHYPKLEGGDLLIIGGDLTTREKLEEYLQFSVWLDDQSYKKKFVIAGNHDNRLAKIDGFSLSMLLGNCSYLCDSGTEFSYFIDGFPKDDEGFLPSGHRTLKIWGCPWTKRFPSMNPKTMAFTVDTEEELEEKFAKIPEDIDILMTHSPPYGLLDHIYDHFNAPNYWFGSQSLRKRIADLKSLKLLVCGHIHEGYGEISDFYFNTEENQQFTIVNASHVNEYYEPVNKPIRIEI